MIPIKRITLEEKLAKRLMDRTYALMASKADSQSARKAWAAASKEKRGVREHLVQMAPGIERCMYCGDNRATDIDHFEPISDRPCGTFEWLNHLLACGSCNSNEKRDRFPRDDEGNPLLVDPTQDDPGLHLRLILATGEYRARTLQGNATIKVFNLNRGDLAMGRRRAYQMADAALCRAHGLLRQGRIEEARERLTALVSQPHASVLQEMLRLSSLPTAKDILDSEVVAALTDQDLLAELRNTF
ncbi:MAG: HNH endonuclease [Streptosporangiales bacterium]|jgi:hypothetical protein|nr:HNH endonuclease [Streptosporangiales bacterium]